MENNQQNNPIEAEGKEGLDTMGINMSSLLNEFRKAQEYVSHYTRDFRELDNLVDAVSINKEPGNPSIGDTTLAGLVRSIPRSSLKQLPVLSTVINGKKDSVTAYLCNYILKETAFNEDTFGKGLLSTLQIGTEQALTHGYAPFLVATGTMYEDFGTTMRLLHFSDVSCEPGISDSNESDYFFVRAHLVPSKVRRMLRTAKKNPDTQWNIPALEALLETPPQPDDYARYEADPKRVAMGQDTGPTYKLVTRYETGPGGRIITFCEEMPDAPLRVIESRSKRGYPRVQFLVIDPAALTPFGTSRVRLASPNQNLMNIYYGNIASMLLINSAPPLLKIGRFTKPTSLKRNTVWESNDPNASIKLVSLDNGALNSFVPMQQQFGGQIQNIMGGQSMTQNAGSKAAVFGKTAPGVQAGQEFMGAETNQITNILENYLRQYGLSALDTILSEQTGDDILIVDDETKNKINHIAEQEFMASVGMDPMTGMPLAEFVPPVGENNEMAINWEELYESIRKMSIVVDVSLSPDELKEKKHADLQDMLVVLAQNAQTIPGAPEMVAQITNMLLQDKSPTVKPMQPQMPMPMPVPVTPEINQEI